MLFFVAGTAIFAPGRSRASSAATDEQHRDAHAAADECVRHNCFEASMVKLRQRVRYLGHAICMHRQRRREPSCAKYFQLDPMD
jgi:hypothetical protein